MDDLSQKINDLLNSPDGMERIQSLMAALGGGEVPLPSTTPPAPPSDAADPPAHQTPSPPPVPPPAGSYPYPAQQPAPPPPPIPTADAMAPAQGNGADLTSLLAGLSGGNPAAAPSSSGAGGLDLSMLARLAPMLSSLQKEDENTALLKALRPYLHGDREKRLDDAIQILKMMRFLPLLQDKGPFSSQ